MSDDLLQALSREGTPPTARELGEPDFDGAGRVHDWRNHVPGVLRSLWHTLSFEARLAVWVCAEHDAEREEWE